MSCRLWNCPLGGKHRGSKYNAAYKVAAKIRYVSQGDVGPRAIVTELE